MEHEERRTAAPRPGEPPTDFERRVLAGCIAPALASSGSMQYDVAYEGFKGIDQMTPDEFWHAWVWFGVDQERVDEQHAIDDMSGRE